MTDTEASVGKSGTNGSSCGCCVKTRATGMYWDVLRSPETIATLVGLGLLCAGWIMGWRGNPAGRWFHLGAAVIAGLPIFRVCLRSLIERRISVEILVALAILASVATGEYQAGAVVAVMLLGGGVLEQVTVSRARHSMTSLLSRMPDTARVKRGNQEVEVATADLLEGDHVLAKPGERLAVDGIVFAGESAVDESPITGESVPVDKATGDKVFAGSVNQSGVLEVEATKVGGGTTLARIQRLVEEAQDSQAPVQRIADRN